MSVRTERVAELLQRELSGIFQKELPRNGALATIVGVKISPDLSMAHVYLSVLGSKEMGESLLAHIRKENKFFRKELSLKIRNQFRRMPELEFHLDDLGARAARLDALIREANKPTETPDK
ncbi:MAG: ribosome-binding factor A [[Candidatus Thermochlorobacteriaceae] bacterium GBChlB]|jgi:ribosome-binding factor A|nr:MAG: ribosome-binding factor A [[Candidatus Thermochlorobacteriaceae] bacterium GBChlB]